MVGGILFRLEQGVDRLKRIVDDDDLGTAPGQGPADSLMSGLPYAASYGLLERHAGVAVIQTVSSAAGRETLFARLQQRSP